MIEKLKIILFFLTVFLIGVGVWHFSNIWKEDNIKTQTTQALKLLTSHSSPKTGEKWVVSFETRGVTDLIITPKDQDTVGDLDFISLKCGEEARSPQVLGNDVISYSDWQCEGKGELTHLVNIARKHTLKFQFGNNIAYAYNNPDSVTETYTDTTKVSTTSQMTVNTTTGQIYSATCKNNGTVCSAAGECCSNFCVDGVCCNSACSGSTCQRCDSYSNAGAGNCGYASSSAVDPDNECPGLLGACASTNCSGSGLYCGYLAVGQQDCSACTYCTGASYSCSNVAADSDPYGSCTGNCDECNGSGACRGDNTRCSGTVGSCYCSGGGTSYNCQTCTDPGLCKYPTCSSYTCGSANEVQDYQESGCTGCNYCNGSGSCLTCDYGDGALISFCIATTPALTCKPSTAGTYGYDAFLCSASSKVGGAQADKCMRHTCGCQ